MLSSWLKSLIRRLGFELMKRSDDPVLEELLLVHRELRLAPQDTLRWDDRLPQPACWSHLRNLLREMKIDLVLDVGANTGQFGRRLRHLGYHGDIISFEPSSAARTALLAAAAGDQRWTIRAEAVGREPGHAQLSIFRDSTFSSLRAINARGRERFGDLVQLVGEETVEVVTLDSICPSLVPGGSRRILLKTDTQGFDLEVLRGASETLKAAVVVLSEATTLPIYESAPQLEELLQTLKRAGFTPSGFYPIGRQAPPSLALIELDCFFVRNASE
jgi:FkbM family methyltransferase